MKKISLIIEEWGKTLRHEIELGSLYSRNPIAHKWKATYRVVVLRELVIWRFVDLIEGILALSGSNNILGSKILLRSGIETVGILFYLNKKMECVVQGSESWKSFEETTNKLMLGSKNKSTNYESINVVTILVKHCGEKYPEISRIYTELSEAAHPNHEGMCLGYSYIDEVNYITKFKNLWREQEFSELEATLVLVMRWFELEYNSNFVEVFESLEDWICENNEKLEREK